MIQIRHNERCMYVPGRSVRYYCSLLAWIRTFTDRTVQLYRYRHHGEPQLEPMHGESATFGGRFSLFGVFVCLFVGVACLGYVGAGCRCLALPCVPLHSPAFALCVAVGPS